MPRATDRFTVQGKTYSSWVVVEEGKVHPVAWVGRDDKSTGRNEAYAMAMEIAATLNENGGDLGKLKVISGVRVVFNTTERY